MLRFISLFILIFEILFRRRKPGKKLHSEIQKHPTHTIKATLLMMKRFLNWALAAGLLWSSVSQAQQSLPLHLQSGTIQAEANLSAFLAAPAPSDVFDGYYYRFLQFGSMPLQAQREQMEKDGLRFLAYLPVNTYMVALPLTYDRNRLADQGVVSVLEQLPAQKISKDIAGGFQDWAVKEKGTADVVIKYHRNIALQTVLPAAARMGQIQSHFAKNHTVTLRISDQNLMKLASEPWVYFINSIPAPSTPDDTRGRSLHRTNMIASDYTTGRHYDGTGVSVAVADDGVVGPHIDFQGRLTNFAVSPGGFHGDMCGGIYAGAGNLDPTKKGMASGADLYTFDIGGYPQIVFALDNFNNYGMVISSTSYSQGCNVYTADTEFGDDLLNQNTQLQAVFSGGNNGSGNCNYGAGSGWGNITGGYKQGKNVIACGNLDALEVLDPSSSRGPSADGRIKPDICSNGRDQETTDENNTYQVGGGTSAASPGIAGIFAQLYQAYKELNGTPLAPAPLIKAALLNSAEDIGNAGPDFTYGWGRVNAFRALRILEQNNYITDSITQGQTNTHSITVPAGVNELRAMIYWADPGGTPAAAITLVNDINMQVTDPSSVSWNPWILDPTPTVAALTAPAIRGIDNRNNVEQVTLSNPAPGVYTVNVNGFAIPTAGQRYYLVWEFRTQEVTMTYPNGGEGLVPGEVELLRWDGRKDLGSYTLDYTTDNGGTWTTIASNIPQAAQQLNWTVPANVSGQVKVRISRGGFSDESDTLLSIINTPSNINIPYACPDSLRIEWNAVTGASAYKVYRLGAKYMEPIGTTTNTFFIATGINPTVDQWFSVSAITGSGNEGRRALAVRKAPGVFNCTINVDAELLSIPTPPNGILQDCHDNSAVPVAVVLRNNGASPITNIPVSFSVNGGTTITETFTGSINPGLTQLFTLNATIDMSVAGTYNTVIWTSFSGDQNIFNDTSRTATTIQAASLATLPYTEDFESYSLCGTSSNCGAEVCGIGNWVNESNGDQDDIDFRVSEGSTPSVNTGPDVDHTLGTASGNYIYLEASQCFNQRSNLISPCIDLTNAGAPELTFWYHMLGGDMGELHIDVYSQGGWTNDVIPALSGNQGGNWQQASVNLVPWAGEIINVRFRAETGGGFESDLALDDINILESSAPPVPAFTADATSGCVGKVFTFSDISLNSPNAWQWVFTPSTVTFVNGTSATSQNPQVTFNTPGTYDVEFTATNGFGGGTVTFNSFITILAPAATPVAEDFQSGVFPPLNWRIEDAGGALTWADTSCTGATGTLTDVAYVENFNYNNVGFEDDLVTFEIDLSASGAEVLTFDVAYARYNSTFSDGLRVDVSTNCGNTWIPSGYLKSGTVLATVPDQTAIFYPAAAGEWRKDTVSLAAWDNQAISVRFVNINGYGNNLFIDNVNISSATGLEQNDRLGNVSVYPNPSRGLFTLELSGAEAKTFTYAVNDIQGRQVMSRQVNAGSFHRELIDLSKAPQGVYLLQLITASGTRTVKLTRL